MGWVGAGRGGTEQPGTEASGGARDVFHGVCPGRGARGEHDGRGVPVGARYGATGEPGTRARGENDAGRHGSPSRWSRGIPGRGLTEPATGRHGPARRTGGAGTGAVEPGTGTSVDGGMGGQG